MNFEYEADRIYLKALTERDADKLLSFSVENADIFMQYEPRYPENFFTREYQELLIRGFLQQFMEERAFRFYIFLKENPQLIIGCVGLNNIDMYGDKKADLFYKLDHSYTGKGYMNEAISLLLWHAAEDLGLHRIQADILPGNKKSSAVVKHLGFEYEGIARSSHQVDGVWQDHERYSLIL